jgi:hypothetical protein
MQAVKSFIVHLVLDLGPSSMPQKFKLYFSLKSQLFLDKKDFHLMEFWNPKKLKNFESIQILFVAITFKFFCLVLGHFTNQLFCQLDNLLTCHFFNVTFCLIAILPTYQFVELPFCQLAILPTCHFIEQLFIDLPFCQLAILSTCHFVNLFFCQFFELGILSVCHFINQPFCQLAISSTSYFWLKI